MLDEKQRIPYYVQIKSYLRKIAAEKRPHDSMPSETQLSELFKVSRGTVKQAIMDLVYEGVLYREQGKGTFVCEPRITRTFERLPSFTEDIRRMGSGPRTRILSMKQAAATPFLQQLFNLAPETLLIKVKRLVSVEESPVVVLTSYLNPNIYPDLQEGEIDDSLYEALQRKYGIVPAKAQDTYTIVDVSPNTAALLKCRKTASVCYSQRIAYLASGLAVEYVESFIRSDRFKLNICIGMDAGMALLEQEDEGVSAPQYDVGFRNIII